MFEHVMAARQRLEGQAHVTPVMTSATFNDRVGAEVFFKCENFQRVGAFKFRGAFNAVACLPDDLRKKGLITFSSGNHAQAVALVGRLMNVPVTVVMPDDAPVTKRVATQGYGADVVLYDPRHASRDDLARALQEERGGRWCRPTIIRTSLPDRARPHWKCIARSGLWICCWCPAVGGCSAVRRWPPTV